MTLSEISRTVDEINASISDRKVRLAPQIKKLRQVRAQFAVSGQSEHVLAWVGRGERVEECAGSASGVHWPRQARGIQRSSHYVAACLCRSWKRSTR